MFLPGMTSTMSAVATPVPFGARYATTPGFVALFSEANSLVEETAAYLDGAGRQDAALLEAGLPVADLEASAGQFYRYRTLGGVEVGYGGFEPAGCDILLRSVVVLPAARGRGIGANLVALLMRRAFDLGAGRAFLLTTTAGPFFSAIGFKAVSRDLAPAALAATRQFTETCPSSAAMFSRMITP